MTTTPAPLTEDASFCTECGRTYRTEDMVRIGNSLVCANCKDLYAQKLREGAAVSGAVQFGGFWRRTGALVLDGLILSVVNLAVSSVVSLIMGPAITPGSTTALAAQFTAVMGVSFLLNICIAMAYQAFFLTRSGATPGKIALGLKVIKADGGPVSAATAIGRYLCYFLDSIILFIGYIMVAFDKEKRALHDHICNTRVIRVF